MLLRSLACIALTGGALASEEGLEPNAPLTDEEFLRRAYLNVSGSIPTYEDTARFLRDRDPQKRFNLVARLLQTEGLSVNVFANTAYLSETIVSLGGAPPLKTGGSYPRYRNYLLEGYAPGQYFGAVLADLPIPLNILTPVGGECVVPTTEQALDYFSVPRNPSSFKPLAVGNSTFGTPNGGVASNNCGSGLLQSDMGKPNADFTGSFSGRLSWAWNHANSGISPVPPGQGDDQIGCAFQ